MVLLASGCAHVKITDSEWCGDMGSQGASCFHTLTPEKRDIPQVQWDDERFGMVCTTAGTVLDWKAVIEKLCSISKRCDYETKKKITAFFKKVLKVKTTSARLALELPGKGLKQ